VSGRSQKKNRQFKKWVVQSLSSSIGNNMAIASLNCSYAFCLPYSFTLWSRQQVLLFFTLNLMANFVRYHIIQVCFLPSLSFFVFLLDSLLGTLQHFLSLFYLCKRHKSNRADIGTRLMKTLRYSYRHGSIRQQWQSRLRRW